MVLKGTLDRCEVERRGREDSETGCGLRGANHDRIIEKKKKKKKGNVVEPRTHGEHNVRPLFFFFFFLSPLAFLWTVQRDETARGKMRVEG